MSSTRVFYLPLVVKFARSVAQGNVNVTLGSRIWLDCPVEYVRCNWRQPLVGSSEMVCLPSALIMMIVDSTNGNVNLMKEREAKMFVYILNFDLN